MTAPNPTAVATWQRPDLDKECRKDIILKITNLLRQRKPDADDAWLNRLPDMAKKLESKLYGTAASLEEYSNESTLKSRLQGIASELKPSQLLQQQLQQSQQPPPPPPPPPSQPQNISPSNPPVAASIIQSPSPPLPPPTQQQPPSSVSPTTVIDPLAVSTNPNAANSAHSSVQREAVLRQQQQRLLLLRHASRCMAKPGTCPATQHCAQMKELWRHIAKCKNQDCNIPHCVSSRYVLSHYHKCQEASCDVCKPVRDAINRHHQNRGSGPQQPPNDNQGNNEDGTPAFPDKVMPSQSDLLVSAQRYHIFAKSYNSRLSIINAKEFTIASTKVSMETKKQEFSVIDAKLKATIPKIVMDAAGVPIPTVDEVEQAQRDALKAQHDYVKCSWNATKLQLKALEAQLHAETMLSQKNMIKEREWRENLLQRCHGDEAKLKELLEKAAATAPSIVTPPAQPAGRSASVVSSNSQDASTQPAAIGRPRKEKIERKQRAAVTKLEKNLSDTSASHNNVSAPSAPPSTQQQSVASSASEVSPATVQQQQQQQRHLDQQHQAADAMNQERLRFISKAPTMSRKFVETSLLNGLDRRDIELHVSSLNRPFQNPKRSFKQAALQLLKRICSVEVNGNAIALPFCNKVDPLDVSDYLLIIKKPMDFGTIKSNLEDDKYRSSEEFVLDMRQVFTNALIYNGDNSSAIHATQYIAIAAKQLWIIFERELSRMQEQELMIVDDSRFAFDPCKLCCRDKLPYEQPVYYCAGSSCRYGRIPRDQSFFVGSENKCWCRKCQASDPDARNDRLVEKKNDENPEEDMVQCCWCLRWYHNVCAMINNRGHDKSKTDDFLCPLCVLRAMDNDRVDRYPPRNAAPPQSQQQPAWKPSLQRANELPETVLSSYLEAQIQRRVKEERQKRAHETSQRVEDVEKPGPISVRVVMSQSSELTPRDGMKRIYQDTYPGMFTMVNKVLLMFERIDGIDVLLFIMFLQYYGSECSKPNSRSLYVAYLDSVNYFRPSFMRTALYHELINATLEYEKQMGYTRCFIWACPPIAGDDYIFHIHSKEQKIPKPAMLRNWYLDMLEDARQRGIVVSVSTLTEEYLSRVPDLTTVPYFDGDYWPTYVEQAVRDLESKRMDPRSLVSKGDMGRKKSIVAVGQTGGDKKTNKSKKARKSKGGGGLLSSQVSSAATALDGGEDGLSIMEDVQITSAVDFIACPTPLPLNQIPWQDALTHRVASEIDRMKSDFIVVKMFNDCAECAASLDQPGLAYWVPPSYNPRFDIHDTKTKRYAPPFALCHGCYLLAYEQEYGRHPSYQMPEFPPSDKLDWIKLVGPNAVFNPMVVNSDRSSSPVPPPLSAAAASQPQSLSVPAVQQQGRKRRALQKDLIDLDTADNLGIEVLDPGKIARAPNPWTTYPCPLNEMRLERAMIRPSTLDVDPLMTSPIFATRDEFLNMCQGNKLQFDELRRAKYSSMMVLYHLHNPNAEAFVHTCDVCKREIDGDRYSCGTCTSFDLCESCFQGEEYKRKPHQHPLRSNKMNKGSQDPQMLLLLDHACECQESQCTFHNCSRMKALLAHSPECPVRITGGCVNCNRYWRLLTLHAKQCHRHPGTCKVVHCDRLKAHLRQKQNNTADRRMQAVMDQKDREGDQQPQQQQVVAERNGGVGRETGKRGKSGKGV